MLVAVPTELLCCPAGGGWDIRTPLRALLTASAHCGSCAACPISLLLVLVDGGLPYSVFKNTTERAEEVA